MNIGTGEWMCYVYTSICCHQIQFYKEMLSSRYKSQNETNKPQGRQSSFDLRHGTQNSSNKKLERKLDKEERRSQMSSKCDQWNVTGVMPNVSLLHCIFHQLDERLRFPQGPLHNITEQNGLKAPFLIFSTTFYGYLGPYLDLRKWNDVAQ